MGKIAIFLFLYLASLTQVFASYDDEFIGVASDNWHFETKTTRQPFVPFGVNYVPAWAGWAPDYFSDQYWEAGRPLEETTAYRNIDRDFLRMSEMGLNITRAMTGLQRVILGASGFGKAVVADDFFVRIDKILDLAKKHHLKVIFSIGHPWVWSPPTTYPSWWIEGNGWFSGSNEFNPKNQNSSLVLADFYRQLAERYKDNPVIFSYSIEVEEGDIRFWDKYVRYDVPRILVEDAREPKASWNSYLKRKFGTVENLRRSWGTDVNVDWNAAPPVLLDIPPAEYKENDPALYEFMLFKEFNLMRYYYPIAKAIKNADLNHMVTNGNHPLSMISQNRTAFVGTRPDEIAILAGVNQQEMMRLFDYASPHLYPEPRFPWDKQYKYLRERLRLEYWGKPVLVEEFNGDRLENNANFVENTINSTKGDAVGWMVWWFQNGANPAMDVSMSSGLIDQNGNITDWGRKYKQIGETVKNLVLTREPPVRTEIINKKFILTSPDNGRVINNILDNFRGPVDFSFEANSFLRENFPPQIKLFAGWNLISYNGIGLESCFKISKDNSLWKAGENTSAKQYLKCSNTYTF